LAIFSFTSGCCITSRVASESFLTTDGGVPAGASSICEVSTTAFGMPASAMVGTSGRSGQRVAPVCAIALSEPDLM